MIRRLFTACAGMLLACGIAFAPPAAADPPLNLELNLDEARTQVNAGNGTTSVNMRVLVRDVATGEAPAGVDLEQIVIKFRSRGLIPFDVCEADPNSAGLATCQVDYNTITDAVKIAALATMGVSAITEANAVHNSATGCGITVLGSLLTPCPAIGEGSAPGAQYEEVVITPLLAEASGVTPWLFTGQFQVNYADNDDPVPGARVRVFTQDNLWVCEATADASGFADCNLEEVAEEMAVTMLLDSILGEGAYAVTSRECKDGECYDHQRVDFDVDEL